MTRHLSIAIVLILTISACAPTFRSSAQDDVVVEQLFFGRNIRGLQAVSDSAWSNFLSEVVTPRFPEGFTVWPATGQWRYADGQIDHEATFVLQLMHKPSSSKADSSIVEIMAAYKQRFQQEAVLRIVTPARASF